MLDAVRLSLIGELAVADSHWLPERKAAQENSPLPGSTKIGTVQHSDSVHWQYFASDSNVDLSKLRKSVTD